jgi:hypothetical protein
MKPDVKHRLTTPALLRLALAANVVLALLFFFAVWRGVRQQRGAIQTIGVDSAPSIIAAQHIKASLADMHASAARELLTATTAGGASREYNDQRRAATEGLLAAAGNITYEGEKEALEKLLNGLGPYQEAVSGARVLRDQVGNASWPFRDASADQLMHNTLLPAADDLDRANRTALKGVYDGQSSRSGWGLAWVVAAGLALLASLTMTQVFLYRRTHRLLNPALLAAAILATGYLGYTFYQLRQAAALLKRAKQDAFDSIGVLEQARADAHDAQGDARRALLDSKSAPVPSYVAAFNTKMDRLAKLPPGMSDRQLLDAARKGEIPNEFTGYLADELRNITFAGEDKAALDTLDQALRIRATAADVWQLAEGRKGEERKVDQAISRCLSTDANGLSGAFARFDTALRSTLDINQKQFDKAIEDGFAALAGFDLSAPLVALSVALLAFLGLRPRLKEYAV